MENDPRIQQAIDVFKDHHLIYESEDRWTIARKYTDGKIKSDYLTEIISLYGGRLFVGGDIDDVVFAYNNVCSKEKLVWIGCGEPDFSYLCQKAQIGMTDDGLLTYEYDDELAKRQLIEYGEKYSDNKEFLEAINEALDADNREEMICSLMVIDDSWEWAYNLGKIPSTRVIYAWAAVNKLCNLLGV